jgi:hypothetical protein
MQAILFVSQQLHIQGLHVACIEPVLNEVSQKQNIHSNVSDRADTYETGMWALGAA